MSQENAKGHPVGIWCQNDVDVTSSRRTTVNRKVLNIGRGGGGGGGGANFSLAINRSEPLPPNQCQSQIITFLTLKLI